MELPPVARFVSRKSKRLSMSGASSSHYEPDLIDIKTLTSKSLKHNQMMSGDGLSIPTSIKGFSHQETNNPTPNNLPPNPTPVVKKKRNLPGTPDPVAEVIALSPKTLMATNIFVCEICNKGFQRDQNLQLHRRGHNLPWKLRQRTSKEVVPDDIVEIDEDDDLGIMLIDEKNKEVGKGKATLNGYDYSWQQVKHAFTNDFAGPSSRNFESMIDLPQFPLDNVEPDPQDLLYPEEDDEDSPDFDYALCLQAQFDAMDLPPGVEASIPWLLDSSENQKTRAGTSSSAVHSQSSSCCEVELAEVDEPEGEVLKKYKVFKQFDVVEDYSDHFYVNGDSSQAKPSKTWTKTIQEEWKMMESGLPDTIFVRVYEERMDLLRAVIVGAAGTPYHDGLFFFDVSFPSNYPNVPPQVHYHSGGLRLNPNLYHSGYVCLSLLNTWTGDATQKWIPGKSTMLQVLVSIQALVLNEEPYFNEPGYERSRGQPTGDKLSRKYNEETFILSCRTMLYSLNRPPKNFEDFVIGHFHEHANDILEACNAYMEGAKVGCFIKGVVQNVEDGEKSCSKTFKKKVYDISNLLFTRFTEIGAKGCMHLAPQQTKEEEDVLDEF